MEKKSNITVTKTPTKTLVSKAFGNIANKRKKTQYNKSVLFFSWIFVAHHPSFSLSLYPNVEMRKFLYMLINLATNAALLTHP